MAPFIKFTERLAGKDGQSRHLRFINAGMIRSALFIEETGVLEIELTESRGRTDFKLAGEEAAAALKILQGL